MMADNKTGEQWNDKAIAFLVRSRQELWGKHNEDIFAWLFQQGFSNAFVKNHMFGWNRRSKFRAPEGWGLGQDYINGTTGEKKLWLPEGVVIPLVIDKHLKKLIIYRHTTTDTNRTYSVPGSSSDPFILGDSTDVVAVVQNILDGFLLFQEAGESTRVIIPDADSNSPDDRAQHILDAAGSILFFSDSSSNGTTGTFSSWIKAYPDAPTHETDRNTIVETFRSAL